jgi:O-antigen/teichoic acid export membrane protein
MLAGRVVSLAVTFATQVIVVRTLSKSSFGGLAYALSVVILVQSLLPLGLDRSDTRFFALYDERRDTRRLLGVLALEGGLILGLGGVVTVLVIALQGLLAGTLTTASAVHLLVLLIALAPVQALDDMILDLFAVFARPGAVFIRRFVLTPGLRLAVVVVVATAHWSVTAIAVGYLVTGVAASLVYLSLVPGLLRGAGVELPSTPPRMTVPAREVLTFSVPLMTSSLVLVVTTSLSTVVLGHYGSASDVAAFRSVQPVAVLITNVMTSFAILFTPGAARLFARGDRAGLHDLYWQTAAWIAMLAFPVAALMIAFPEPVITTLFGDRYAGSQHYLLILAVGTYVQSATGFNGVTLQIAGRVRYVVVSNLAVTMAGVGAAFALVPAFGALGAAIATAGAMLVHNLVKQLGLALGTGVAVLDRRYLGFYAAIAALLLMLTAARAAASPGIAGAVALTAAASVLLVVSFRSVLRLGETFPVLRRLGRRRS